MPGSQVWFWKKHTINVLVVRNSREFLGSASLENSKQCDEDVKFLATVSSNLHVDVHFHCSSCSFNFPRLSLTEVMWILNLAQKRTLTLVCLAVRCRYHKIDKNNQVDVNIVRTFRSHWFFIIHSNCSVAISYVKLAFKLLRKEFGQCESPLY